MGLVLLVAGSASAATATDPQTQTMQAPKRFGLADVRRRAEDLAAQPFVQERESDKLTPFLRDMDYDQFRDIRFRKDKTIWFQEGLPFVLRFFHMGFLFNRAVTIHLVEDGDVRQLPFGQEFFDYGQNQVNGEQVKGMSFAGMQIFYPLRGEEEYDEVAVFLGASYFRAVALGQSYGLSARGLAVDTGLERGEEFPVFREFWVEKPDKDATSLTLYALLDSASVTGAYRFVIRPGAELQMEVKKELFARADIHKLGIAPLTSMFYHGENKERWYDDFRPEVHDSDGLLVNFGSGEWLWRPLDNRRRLRMPRFYDTKLRGFGLLQRDRNFANYQDLEADYHKRPSTWVEPLSDWGPGSVELVEIPTDAERHDNIVSYWVPEKAVKAGDQLSFEYRLRFGGESLDRVPGARVMATRIGGGGTDSRDQGLRKFAVDFVGANLGKLPADALVKGVVTASKGEIRNLVVQHNPSTQGWRLYFELDAGKAQEVELRAFLRLAEDVLSETWGYQWFKR